MRTIFILFDSLNRHFLECYGSDLLHTPNFRRLSEKAVTFDQHHVGSLPCIHARRDLQTGKLSFMHRSWGPLEPFDQSVFDQLRTAGVYSHLITDHYHYFEEGAGNYHTKYSSFEFVRGQEGDKWQAPIDAPLADWQARYHADQFNEKTGSLPFHYMANRSHLEETGEFPSTQCFNAACTFLNANKAADDWFLQIETFDPHEPFFAPEDHRSNGRKQDVGRYHAGGLDRSRLSAGGTSMVGEKQNALLLRNRPHTVVGVPSGPCELRRRTAQRSDANT